MGTVIGPIPHADWYCMRQCNEIINHLKTLHDPKYDLEIKAEKEILQHFKDGIKRYAA